MLSLSELFVAVNHNNTHIKKTNLFKVVTQFVLNVMPKILEIGCLLLLGLIFKR